MPDHDEQDLPQEETQGQPASDPPVRDMPVRDMPVRDIGVRDIDVRDAHPFAQEELLDGSRSLPVIGLTSWPNDGVFPIDADALARTLGSRARVVRIETGAPTRALSDALPRRLDVFGGAARIWWPGLSAYSDPYDHPLLFIRDRREAEAAERRIVSTIRSTPVGPARSAAVRAPVGDPPAAPRGGSATEDADSVLADLRRRLADANAQAAELRRELRSTTDRLRHLEQRASGDLDPTASETGFLTAVRVEHARRFDETDRQRYPLGAMRVGRAFLDHLRGLEGVSIEKVIEVCAQVASGRAHHIPARMVHHLGSGHPAAPQGVRETDGGRAWRCSLQDNTPSARRLHWWDISGPAGRTIEFAGVSVHDDFSIPE